MSGAASASSGLAAPVLVSERIGQFFFEGARLEYTEYGSGDRLVVLLHMQLMPRRMHEPLARRIAASGYRVITLDLLGHGRSDRPNDPQRYSMSAFARQVVGLLDHLGVESAVVGGTSLGANVSLEVADLAPERLRGMVLEMPVLDNALEAGIVVFGPLLFFGRVLPWSVSLVTAVTKAVPRGLVPFWVGIALDTLNQQPAPMAAGVPVPRPGRGRPVLVGGLGGRGVVAGASDRGPGLRRPVGDAYASGPSPRRRRSSCCRRAAWSTAWPAAACSTRVRGRRARPRTALLQRGLRRIL